VQDAAAINGTPQDSVRAPRKPRRRRGGQRIDGAVDQANRAVQTPAPVSTNESASHASKPSLLTRIGKGLKSLVTRAPRSQH